MKRSAQSDAGFSLLETLLGLTLTAIIGLLMMGSMQMGARVWERQRAAEPPGASQLLMTQVGEWLAQALPLKIRDFDEPSYAPFRGEPRNLTFQYATQGLGGGPGVYTINLQLVEGVGCPGRFDLYLQAQRVAAAPQNDRPAAPEPVDRRRLVACIENPSFVFWDGLAADTDSGWRQDWIDQPTIPAVVRLRSIGRDTGEESILTRQLIHAPR